MRKASLCLSAAAVLWMSTDVQAKGGFAGVSGCAHESAKQCLDRALEAMGGRDRLQQVKSVRLHTIGHTLLAEQSYRQEPFITSYERRQTTLDLVPNAKRVPSVEKKPCVTTKTRRVAVALVVF